MPSLLLKETLLSQIQIIMVNTTLPANIGAAARAMKTMGLSQLILVAPKTFPSPDATALAAGASDILDHVKIVATLKDAIEESHLVFATSARQRSIPWPLLEVREAAIHAIQEIQSNLNLTVPRKVSIIFGREDRGLTNEELSLANYHLTIPVNEEYGVLNVAAAIQIIAYELRMAAQASTKQSAVPADSNINSIHTKEKETIEIWDEPLVDHAAMNQFYPHFEAMLEAIDFMDPQNPRLMPLRIRRLFGRIRLDQMEYNLLRGIFGRVQALVKGTWPPENMRK